MKRAAFWNVYKPGCDEHVMVHKLRESREYVPELDFVAESDGKIVGNVMCSRAIIRDQDNQLIDENSILIVGPICVLPDHQKKGIGACLMETVKKVRI